MAGTIEEETEILSNKVNEARIALQGRRPKMTWRTHWWLAVVAVGVAIFMIMSILVFAGVTQIQGSQTKILNTHTSQIHDLKQQIKKNHSESYPVIVSLCEHTPGCVVAVTSNSKK
jgi:cell division protein FtsL